MKVYCKNCKYGINFPQSGIFTGMCMKVIEPEVRNPFNGEIIKPEVRCSIEKNKKGGNCAVQD